MYKVSLTIMVYNIRYGSLSVPQSHQKINGMQNKKQTKLWHIKTSRQWPQAKRAETEKKKP